MSDYFSENAFRRRMDNAQTSIQRILSSQKAFAIRVADEVPHKYEDKYLLAEQCSKCALAAVINTFLALGLTNDQLNGIVAWSKDNSVTFELEINRTCKFEKETVREEEGPKVEVERTGFFGGKTTVKTVTKIAEYHYLFQAHWQLRAYRGTGRAPADTLNLLSRHSEQLCTVRSKTSPYSESTKVQHTVELGWLFCRVRIGAPFVVDFAIDRSRDDCYTPRRNKEILDVISGLLKTRNWCNEVDALFAQEVCSVQGIYAKDFQQQDLSMLRTAGVFVPVLGFFEHHLLLPLQAIDYIHGLQSSLANHSEALLSTSIVDALFSEQQQTLGARFGEVVKVYGEHAATKRVFSGLEGKIVVAMRHLEDIVQHYFDCVNFIEDMIRKQLVAAIGKEVQPSDFSEYMIFHSRKLLKDDFQLCPFSHSVRRTVQHSPEGAVSIEAPAETSGSGSSGSNRDPIMTLSRGFRGGEPMEFFINASTKIRFTGERYVHGWMGHRFSTSSAPSLNLVAEARQFSSFILLVGRIPSATTFDPKQAFIVQNKDRMVIPLLLETIPTPKEFRDAIESLSPEQQRFAKAFRAMQLESTLFAVCIVQIKPQLEKVLNLHADSLMKEIKLTQDLMKLFIDYQISSDLLSFEGSNVTNTIDRIDAVKGHVAAMNTMIDEKKNEEVTEITRQRDYDGAAWKNKSKPEEVVECSSQSDFEDMLSQVENLSRIAASITQELDLQCGALDDLNCKVNSVEPVKKVKKGRSITANLFAGKGGTSMAKSVAPSSFTSTSSANTSSAVALGGKTSLPPPPPSGGLIAKTFSPPAPCPPLASVAPPVAVSSASTPLSTNPQPTEEPYMVANTVESCDLTKYPSLLDEHYERLDRFNAVRPTIIKVGPTWSKSSQKTLLSKMEEKSIDGNQQDSERRAAFDLLDALSRSGGLVLENVSLHVVIAATHSFDDTLMTSVVRKNINPIERVERSLLIMGSVVHSVSPIELLRDNQISRVRELEPSFLQNGEDDERGRLIE